MMNQVNQSKVVTLCCLIEAILIDEKTPSLSLDPNKADSIICGIFAFCYTWAVAANLTEEGWESWDTFIREQMEDNADARLPQATDAIQNIYYIRKTFCYFYEKL